MVAHMAKSVLQMKEGRLCSPRPVRENIQMVKYFRQNVVLIKKKALTFLQVPNFFGNMREVWTLVGLPMPGYSSGGRFCSSFQVNTGPSTQT